MELDVPEVIRMCRAEARELWGSTLSSGSQVVADWLWSTAPPEIRRHSYLKTTHRALIAGKKLVAPPALYISADTVADAIAPGQSSGREYERCSAALLFERQAGCGKSRLGMYTESVQWTDSAAAY